MAAVKTDHFTKCIIRFIVSIVLTRIHPTTPTYRCVCFEFRPGAKECVCPDDDVIPDSDMLQHARSPRILPRSVLVRRVHRRYSVYSRTPEPAPPEVAHLLATYAQHTPRPLTLGTLLATGHPLTPESVLTSVSYAQAEIPRRLATRIRSLESLPFIVGTNPYIARILDGFRKSFLWNATYPQVKNLEENAIFTAQLEALVQDHANDLPTMAKG
jgi:hypothetical protein